MQFFAMTINIFCLRKQDRSDETFETIVTAEMAADNTQLPNKSPLSKGGLEGLSIS